MPTFNPTDGPTSFPTFMPTTNMPTFQPTDGPTSEEAEVGVGMEAPTDRPSTVEIVVTEAALRYEAVSTNSISDVASLRFDAAVTAMGPMQAAAAATEARKQGILNRERNTGLRGKRRYINGIN